MAHTLSVEDPMDETLDEVNYTKIYLRKTGLFVSHLAVFEGLAQNGKALRAKADGLGEAVFEAEIEVGLCDGRLNVKCEEVLSHVNDMNDEKERGILRVGLLGHKAPSVFCRPILGGQLRAMKSWPAMIAELSYEPLKNLAPSLQGVVSEGVAAEADLEAKEQAEDNFYFVGEYKKYIEQVNAARKLLEGEAEAYRHSHPELNLPRDFALALFRKREREKDLTPARRARRIASVEALLERLKGEQQAWLDAVSAEEEARKEAARQARLSQIAQKEKEAMLLAEQLAALKAQIP